MANQQYDNTNRGVLFKSDKRGNPKRPDWFGKIDIDGKEYKLSGWNKTGQRGEFISIARDTYVAPDKPASDPSKSPYDKSVASPTNSPYNVPPSDGASDPIPF